MWSTFPFFYVIRESIFDYLSILFQEKRESVEVALTLDILKHGKRFHATVSFDTDTGLKQALATVNDYNPLMKVNSVTCVRPYVFVFIFEKEWIKLALLGIFFFT